jgi:CRISPR/Cas system-associated protein Cas10 (large subunit of type III CRISPR-Cas system)
VGEPCVKTLHTLSQFFSLGQNIGTRYVLEVYSLPFRYIEDHHDEVMVVHRQIENRKARGNPPAILTKAAKSRAKVQEWLKHHHETKT